MGNEIKIKQKRIFEIAKELNISHIEIIKFLKKENIPCKTIMTAVDEAVYLKILEEFAVEKDVVERFKKEKARREAEFTRKAEEEARQSAELERKKIEEGVFKNAIGVISSAVNEVIKYSIDIKSLLIESVRESEETTDVFPETIVKKEKEIKTEQKVSEKKREKKKQKEKRKFRKVAISEIESRLDQKTGRRRGVTEDEKQKGKWGKKEKVIDSKKVEESIRRTMAKIDEKSTRKKYKKQETPEVKEDEVKKIKISEFATVETLASIMDVDPADVIQKCMQLGMFVTINQRLDFDTISVIADELGFEAEQMEQFGEELLKIEETEEDLKNAVPRPPVIAIMGHVDHGKTSLLDYIRKENVVAGEAGGITQHIGAYQVELKNKKKITFLDTPGHEAFTAMRARGAQVTDIVVLIVAADDGVMPRTIEAINHSKAANVPLVVAINKIDKPEADVEKVKRGLSDQGVLVESWGGKVQTVEISAKTGQGIDHLLDLLLLEAEMLELKANADTYAQGTIIESRVDRRHGPVATVLIQKGTLKVGNPFVCGASCGRVRALFDERGRKIKTVKPSDPVIVVGFDILPSLAGIFSMVAEASKAKRIAGERQRIQREQQYRQIKEWTLDAISAQIAEGKIKQLNVILKCDVDGSVEAISETLTKIGNEEVAINIIHKAAGQVSESDVLLAKASTAVIVGFNVAVNPKVRDLAKKENIEIRRYSVIYELVDDITLALEGLLTPDSIEEHLGEAEVREVFKIPHVGFIAGCYVVEGIVIRNAIARLKREDDIICEGPLTSLKRFKDDVKEVQEGFECGIAIEGFNKYKQGDRIEIFELKSVKRTLS
ncbi:MAG: translation initiation factor IF-2 [Candidatus Marinimicrobia bacterium]|nr:translation initiation factor IF-2 [Candidatus Neomarinimicrobiota bacterium]